MGGLDNATWQALGLVLTLLGLGISAFVWARHGPASGLRAVAWSLLPLAAALTGVLRLAWDIGHAVAWWVARLVFSPVVWLGLVVTAVAVALFVVSGFLRRHGRRRPVVAAATPGDRQRISGTTARQKGSASAGASGGDLADMGDIEEILRKHGIT